MVSNGKTSVGVCAYFCMYQTKYQHNIAFFWNGRAETLEEQMILGPLFDKKEMASSKEIIEDKLIK